MKLNQALVKVISAASAAALQDAVNVFLKASAEATLLDTHYAVDGGVYSAMVVYTN